MQGAGYCAPIPREGRHLMGLDIGKAHWSYGGFTRFRERLAREIGVTLWAMENFCAVSPEQVAPYRRMPPEWVPIPWSTVRDPIAGLLNHSDCEGTLSADQCHAIAPRLREICGGWPEDDYDRRQAFILAEMMDEVDAPQLLEFH